ncbi:MAG TPA: ECF-type sigma factor [Vicinamibacterales bacterium]
MSEAPDAEIGALVQASKSGNREARDQLFTILYRELHRLAQYHLAKAGGPLTLSATTLLHEAYLDISRRELAFPERNRFMSYASRAMRGLVIDYCRSRRAQKRGGDLTFLSIDDVAPRAESTDAFEQLDLALQELEAKDSPLAQLVDLKFFCGFSFGELAAMRGVSERTVRRDWEKARLLLYRTISLPD